MTSFWLDRPTFITGATGFVGGWLLKHLIKAGADVVCLVRDWVPQCELVRSGTLESVRVVRGDVQDQAVLERALGECEIDTVIHLAAQTVVNVANRNPLSTFKTNIQGTWSLLESCRRSSTVKQVIIASSDKAYGDQESLPYSEGMPLQGRHPYDVSKSCADLLATAYAATYALPVAVTRCGNFFGGGDLNWNRLVPGTIRSVLRGKRPVIRSDGDYVRDYLYVEDGGAAYMLLAEHLSDNPSLRGQAFNFSNEVRISVREVVERILSLMGSALEPEVRNEALNEIRQQFLAATKARDVLGWRPLFSLDEGLRRTIQWYSDYFAETS
ncbi:MAG: GDP-mannose 4,6-dehydratase [Thermoanaerobaculaceae bacterium]|nr:GDP-mannose 4,6-dehydratase [Thermoanaerobaculaceae bacterium]